MSKVDPARAAFSATIFFVSGFAAAKSAHVFTPTARDSTMIELGEWATRNSLYVPVPESPKRKKLTLYVVGCHGSGECLFVHQADARIRIFEPRLKDDWIKLLRSANTKAPIREISCIGPTDTPANLPAGTCTVTNSAMTRANIRKLSPDLARHMGDERSPAAIKVLRKRR